MQSSDCFSGDDHHLAEVHQSSCIMADIGDLADVAVRQVAAAASIAASIATSAASDTTPCSTSNDYDGRMGIRISAIFVILVGSLFGMNPAKKHEYYH